MSKKEFDISRADLVKLAIAFDIARALRRDRATGEEYTIGKFSKEYLNRSQSLVSKVLTGQAKSMPVLKAISRFVLESEAEGRILGEVKLLAEQISDK